jgi:DNA-directed RNA polymerase III subunit RPC8
MFILTTVVDRIRVPAHMLSLPTLTALHNEIDLKYPNRVLMNFGLVICRYGECLKITNGACVPGDGGSHHECLFRLVVFRPFVEEVCVGKIVKSTPEGIQVSLGGFYHDIHIPAYWMLRPSRYNDKLGLWVWSPDYGNGDEDDADGDGADNADIDEKLEEADGISVVKLEEGTDPINNNDSSTTDVKAEEGGGDGDGDGDPTNKDVEGGQPIEEEAEGGEHFEMELGAEIRFKIKSIHFTQVTKTAKGVQATTTTTAHSHEVPTSNNKEQEEGGKSPDQPRSIRKRSLSVEISDMSKLPASMNIVASICEDGLGLTSWWTSEEEEGEGEDE